MLPEIAGEKIVLLVRDPWWLFAFWSDALAGRPVLRVYRLNPHQEPETAEYFDLEPAQGAVSCTIDVGRPDTEWIVEIGSLATGGHFSPRARSNRVKTPRSLPSVNQDSSWMESSPTANESGS